MSVLVPTGTTSASSWVLLVPNAVAGFWEEYQVGNAIALPDRRGGLWIGKSPRSTYQAW
jgi:hypothetical protein